MYIPYHVAVVEFDDGGNIVVVCDITCSTGFEAVKEKVRNYIKTEYVSPKITNETVLEYDVVQTIRGLFSEGFVVDITKVE